MQNSPEVEFNKFIFQNLLKYVPENLVNKAPQDNNVSSTNVSSLSSMFWNSRKPGLVERLWPLTLLIGMFEVVIGLNILLFIGLFSRQYNTMYGTEDSKLMGSLSFFGCVGLIITGLILLFALMLERQRPIRFYIFMSVFLCVYMFVIACVKIHWSLLVIERDANKIIVQAAQNNTILSTACFIGIGTLFGSVTHFIATVTVFSYYNLKYIQPVST